MPKNQLNLKIAGMILFSATVLLVSTLHGTSESISSRNIGNDPVYYPTARVSQVLASIVGDIGSSIRLSYKDTNDDKRPSSFTTVNSPSSQFFPFANHDDKRTSNHSLLKRDYAADYRAALCSGSIALGAIQNAQNNPSPEGQYFLPTAFDNGWTKTGFTRNLDYYWREYFDDQLGPNRVPPSNQIHYVRIDQNRDFTNTRGDRVRALGSQFDRPHYHALYIPVISAIVIKNMQSPNYVFKNYWQGPQDRIPPNAEIAARYVPPLNRWSDVAWTLYGELTPDVNRLQFICHDNIITTFTYSVVQYIFELKRQSAFVPYPGLELGMDSPEGQALLGTPNGLGTAWLLIDRARELGRRNLKVTVWSEGPTLNMAWNMAPP
ncbi:MAG: hypothetical protein Q9170_004791 [Blastenia crenularia]